jgi:FLVCR family MFS transporter 7
VSIITASSLLLVGNWIRYGATRSGSHGSFPGVMFGQILIGFAQPFVLAAPTRYPDLWFSNRGRIAAMSLANPLGGAVAQLVGPELANEPGEIPFMVLVISIVVRITRLASIYEADFIQATVACVPSFFLPARPPTPASASASTPKQDILPSLRHLLKLPEFYMVGVPFFFYVGLFNSLSSLINQFLQPYSFTETQAGIAGALLIVVGLVASAITSPIIDRTKSYLMAIKIMVPFIALSYLVFTFAPSSRSEIAPYIILAVLGASSFSLVPVVLEYMIELTHPISPEVTSTICWTGGQILGGIFIIISGELRASGKSDGTQDDGSSRPPGNMYIALVFQTVMAMVALPAPLMLGLFGRKDAVRMRRVEADKEAAARRLSDVS